MRLLRYLGIAALLGVALSLGCADTKTPKKDSSADHGMKDKTDVKGNTERDKKPLPTIEGSKP